jgi:hypothetical protein
MRLSPIASGRGGNIPCAGIASKAGMRWKSKMYAFRFLTIFAAAIAAWMVFMWFTLAAVSASERHQSDQSRRPATPASAVQDPPLPISAGTFGARWKLDAATPTREGGAA